MEIVDKMKFVADELRLEGRVQFANTIDSAIEKIEELQRHLEAKIMILASKNEELNSLKTRG
jgi:hypothetical protein